MLSVRRLTCEGTSDVIRERCLRGKPLLVIILLSAFAPPAYGQVPAGTFTNPLVRTRDSADPWMVYRGGYYYFTATLDPDGGIWVWRSRTLAGLDSGLKVKVHTPDAKERAKQIWAPELHLINDRWYIYYTASDGVDENHRLYVLGSRGRDPLGPYSFKARVYDPSHDGWAIDPTVLRAPGGRLYLLWVAHVPGNGNGIRIAPLSNPWTVAGGSALIAQADYDWERVRYPINEGPVVLRRAGRLFLVYSASDTGTPDYALGMLTHTGGDVTDPNSWKKSPAPVFSRYAGAEGAVYGPGHNGFFKSPDGREDWIIYHGKETREYTYRGRTTRAQRFRWRADGTPDFGLPVPRGVPIRAPSGERRPRVRSRPARPAARGRKGRGGRPDRLTARPEMERLLNSTAPSKNVMHPAPWLPLTPRPPVTSTAAAAQSP